VRGLVVLAAVAAVACSYSTSFRDCEVRCDSDGSCPDDFACDVNGLCREHGATTTCSEQLLDAGVDAATSDATSDALLPMPPSCIELPATCGPTSSSPCCDSPLVPGGTFDRSYDVGSDGLFSDATFPATVSAFRLDAYEVTVGRFRAFVNAVMGTQEIPPSIGVGSRSLNGESNQAGWDPSWDTNLATTPAALIADVKCDTTHQSWTDAPGSNESLPMNCITWYEAFAFCAWDSGFLPTEAEWNYAASGGDAQRAYPWSSPSATLDIDCTHANYDPGSNPSAFCENPPNGGVAHVGDASPKGDGRWGQADLGGNVLEWTLDGDGTYSNPCDDCANLTNMSSRIIRGGSFLYDAPLQRGAARKAIMANFRSGDIGVRCAR
jgi:formylglycine-generating enzyme